MCLLKRCNGIAQQRDCSTAHIVAAGLKRGRDGNAHAVWNAGATSCRVGNPEVKDVRRADAGWQLSKKKGRHLFVSNVGGVAAPTIERGRAGCLASGPARGLA